MSHFATKAFRIRVAVWLVWFLVILASLGQSGTDMPTSPAAPLLGVVVHDVTQSGALFPCLTTSRWKKWALHKDRTWRSAHQRAKRTAQMARLAMQGVLTMAQVVDWLTTSQMRYQLGALPVLYALLETLQVRQIINRHCPAQRDVDHGAVAIVLVLNRLMLPLPIYQIADWVGQTVLVSVLGIPASKFNDDRCRPSFRLISQKRCLVQQPCRQDTCCQTICFVEPVQPEGVSVSPASTVTHKEHHLCITASPDPLDRAARPPDQPHPDANSISLFDCSRAKSRLRSSPPARHRALKRTLLQCAVRPSSRLGIKALQHSGRDEAEVSRSACGATNLNCTLNF